MKTANPHIGESLESFLRDEGIVDEVTETAIRRAVSDCKIQSHQDLRNEMKAVARGEMPAPEDSALPSREG